MSRRDKKAAANLKAAARRADAEHRRAAHNQAQLEAERRRQAGRQHAQQLAGRLAARVVDHARVEAERAENARIDRELEARHRLQWPHCQRARRGGHRRHAHDGRRPPADVAPDVAAEVRERRARGGTFGTMLLVAALCGGLL